MGSNGYDSISVAPAFAKELCNGPHGSGFSARTAPTVAPTGKEPRTILCQKRRPTEGGSTSYTLEPIQVRAGEIHLLVLVQPLSSITAPGAVATMTKTDSLSD